MPVEKHPSKDLATRLRVLRDREGLSLATVSSMLAVPEDSLEQIEAGTMTAGPDVDRVTQWLDTTVVIDQQPDL